MNRTTFRDLHWCASWICRVTDRVHIAWTQTDRHSILRWRAL